MIVALNMSDLARQRGYKLDRARLESELGVPVVETVAVQSAGARELVAGIDALCASLEAKGIGSQRAQAADPAPAPVSPAPVQLLAQNSAQIEATQREARRILRASAYVEPLRTRALTRIDAVVMHPVGGPLLLAALLFAIFQAVFTWAAAADGMDQHAA